MDRARDLMTAQPSTLKTSDPVRAALKLIVERQHHSVPVLGPDGLVVGLLTEDALLKAVVLARSTGGLGSPIESVRQILAPAIFVDEDEPFLKVAQKLLAANLARVLVLNSDRQLVGIISPRDLLAHISRKEV